MRKTFRFVLGVVECVIVLYGKGYCEWVQLGVLGMERLDSKRIK